MVTTPTISNHVYYYGQAPIVIEFDSFKTPLAPSECNYNWIYTATLDDGEKTALPLDLIMLDGQQRSFTVNASSGDEKTLYILLVGEADLSIGSTTSSVQF